MVLSEMLGVKENEKFWLTSKKGKVKGNPFQIKSNTLYDSYDTIRDEMVGLIVRGAVRVKASVGELKDGEFYWFMTESGTLRSKRAKGDMLDLYNRFMGNVFLEKSPEATEKGKKILALLENGSSFPWDEKEHKENLEEGSMRGVLRESFAAMREK